MEAENNILMISILSMGGLGIFFSLILAFANTRLRVEEDPRVEEVHELLPGADCGGCGFPSCGRYAEMVVQGKAPSNACVVGGEETAHAIAGILGIEAEEVTKKVARVLCRGGEEEAVRRSEYRGIKTCAASQLTGGGDKACRFGCLGYGDCVRVCPFDAIYMDDNGLPVVIIGKCTGCGKCAEACPREIIWMCDAREKVHNYCVSHDPGKVVRKLCKVGCIVCKICERDCPHGAIKMVDNLAVIDYIIEWGCEESIRRCPTKCLRVSETVELPERKAVEV